MYTIEYVDSDNGDMYYQIISCNGDLMCETEFYANALMIVSALSQYKLNCSTGV